MTGAAFTVAAAPRTSGRRPQLDAARGAPAARGDIAKQRIHVMTSEHEEELRDFVRDVFATGTTSNPPKQTRTGNHVPREGTNPPAPADPDTELRAFTRELFDN